MITAPLVDFYVDGQRADGERRLYIHASDDGCCEGSGLTWLVSEVSPDSNLFKHLVDLADYVWTCPSATNQEEPDMTPEPNDNPDDLILAIMRCQRLVSWIAGPGKDILGRLGRAYVNDGIFKPDPDALHCLFEDLDRAQANLEAVAPKHPAHLDDELF